MGLRSRWLLAVVPFAVACGGDAEPDYLENVVIPDAGEHEATGDGGVGATGRDGGGKPTYTYDGGEEDIDFLDPDASCAASSVAAEQVTVEKQVEVQVPVQVEVKVPVQVEVKVPAPVALYVQFDRSLSMGWSNLWAPAVKAMKSFVQDTDSSGIDVALGYFPGNGSCSDGSGYDKPSVAMGRLPENAAKIGASLDGNSPSGAGTPIEGALRGAIAYCKSFQLKTPGEECVAVLVTDGKPELAFGCSESATDLANIAKAAFEGSNSVRTFAVGLAGADFGLLDKIAQAGGAADCDTASARFSCDVSSGPDKLSAALGKIRDTVTKIETKIETRIETKLETKIETRLETVVSPLACTWAMPEPAPGVPADKNKVNVTVGGGTGLSLPLGKVPTKDTCKIGGWYFDDPSNPKQIVACPETCAAITAAKATDVKIALGCETQVLVI